MSEPIADFGLPIETGSRVHVSEQRDSRVTWWRRSSNFGQVNLPSSHPQPLSQWERVWSLDILRSNSRGLTLTRPAATLSPRARERSSH